MLFGQVADDLSGQVRPGFNSKGKSTHSVVCELAGFLYDKESMQISFVRLQKNFPKHLRDVGAQGNAMSPEFDQDVW